MKNLIKNRRGTAEVIGTIMFIIILVFFFTNVYLWHDSVTKDANQLYIDKINSAITVSLVPGNPHQLNVTDNGGMDATLSMLWVDAHSLPLGSPDPTHGSVSLNNIVVPAGSSATISWNNYSPQPGQTVTFKVISTVGNQASCSYQF